MEKETETQPDELVIELRKPVELTGEVYTELRLREPTCGEVAAAQKTATGMVADIILVALVSGVPKAAVEKIGYRDVKRAVDYLAGFM